MIADLDTLLTALYMELTDRIIPIRGYGRRGPGKPPEVTDAELVCVAVAQALLGWTLHQLRHSALQHLAADGRTAPELQAKSRHLHLGSLGRYVQLGRPPPRSPPTQTP